MLQTRINAGDIGRLLNSRSVMAVGKWDWFDGLVQDWGNSSALALELPQSCTEPLAWLQLAGGAIYVIGLSKV